MRPLAGENGLSHVAASRDAVPCVHLADKRGVVLKVFTIDNYKAVGTFRGLWGGGSKNISPCIFFITLMFQKDTILDISISVISNNYWAYLSIIAIHWRRLRDLLETKGIEEKSRRRLRDFVATLDLLLQTSKRNYQIKAKTCKYL